jgi:hypothetical protein
LPLQCLLIQAYLQVSKPLHSRKLSYLALQFNSLTLALDQRFLTLLLL